MNEEHMKAIFDSFVSLVKPFAKDLECITLIFMGETTDDFYSGSFENGKERLSFRKNIQKDVDEWKGGNY